MSAWYAIIFMVNALTGEVTVSRGDFGSDLAYCQTIVAYASMQVYTTKVETNCPVPRNQRRVLLGQQPGVTWCRLEHELAPTQEDERITEGVTGCVVEQRS